MPADSALTLTCVSQFQTLHLTLDWTEDTWPSNEIEATVKVQHSTVWGKKYLLDALDMVPDRHTALQMKSVVLGLAEGTSYPVEVTFTRYAAGTDTVLERQFVTGTYTTRTPIAQGAGAIVYISPTGSNSTGTGTYANPFLTPGKAEDSMGVGGTIVFKNGTYSRPTYNFATNADWLLTTGFGGTAENPRTIKAETAGSVIIDGSKLLTGLTWTQHGSHTNIWWAPFTNAADFIDTDTTPDHCPGVIKNELTGNYLLIYDWLEPNKTVTNVTASGTTYTLTCSSGDRPSAGTFVCLNGIDGTGNMEADLNRNGLYVATTPTSTTFTIEAISGTASGTYSSGGEFVGPSYAPAMTQEDLDLEGYCIDWTNERIYIRQKAARAGTEPASDEYAAGSHFGPSLRLNNATYTLVEGLTFKMFYQLNRVGSDQFKAAASTPFGAMRFGSGCSNVTLRNCVFECAGYERPAADSDWLTIEDCTFTAQNFIDKVYANPLDTRRWQRFNGTSNNAMLAISVSAAGNKTVFRRNTITGYHHGIVGLTNDANDNSDWYENTFASLTGKAFRFDSDDAPGCMRNGTIFHNTAERCYGLIDVSNHYAGPLWVVSNLLTDYFGTPWQKFGDPSNGWFIDINNSFWTDLSADGPYDSTDEQPIMFLGIGGTGATAIDDGYETHINSIFRAKNARYFIHGSTSVTGTPGTVFRTCAFYSPTTPSPTWEYHNVDYASEALLLAHVASHGDDLTLDGNFYGDEPYPDGIDDEVDSSIRNSGTHVRGVTNIAADSSGELLDNPIGYFQSFSAAAPSIPSQSDRTLQQQTQVNSLSRT